jgi:SAM-dependent methyltransferase
LPLPFATSSVDEIVLSHIIEHLEPDEINALFSETFRVLRPNGFMTISVPHAMTVAFNSDPTHKTRFTFETFYYFTREHPFSYYKQLDSIWQIDRIWASVNLANNLHVPAGGIQLWLEGRCSKVMSYLVRHSRSQTLPDLLVKTLPFWLVNIHCRMSKAKNPTAS